MFATSGVVSIHAVDDSGTIGGHSRRSLGLLPLPWLCAQSLLVQAASCAYAHPMKPSGLRQAHNDSRGRTWSVVIVPTTQADDEDAEFWQTLTPEQRVVAVHDCLESALKAQGKTRVPRLRRVARVVKR